MKTCCMCKETKSVDQFMSNRFKKDGKQAQCIPCQKAYRRNHYLRNSDKYIQKANKWNSDFKSWWKEYKSQFACSKCPENHPACIQFHHTEDNKTANVAKLVLCGNKAAVLAEIAKCIPLCANCHFKEHWNLRNPV